MNSDELEEEPELCEMFLDVFKVHQGSREFYVGVASPGELNRLTDPEEMKLIDASAPRYDGIQRGLSSKKVSEIVDYASTGKALFPSAVIVAVNAQFVEVSLPENAPGVWRIHISGPPGCISIIDGQHRLRGLVSADTVHEVPVVMFIDMDHKQKAELFVRINSTQTPVNPSIAYQLLGVAGVKSPRRTAHQVAMVLATNPKSPFYKLLKPLGKLDEWTSGDASLSQATFARELMTLYTGNPLKDENAYLAGREPKPDDTYPLRALFLAGNKSRIAAIVTVFFTAVAKAWPEEWSNPKQYKLRKSVGYVALMRVLRELLLRNGAEMTAGQVGAAIKAIHQTRTEAAWKEFWAGLGSSYGDAGKAANALLEALPKPPP